MTSNGPKKVPTFLLKTYQILQTNNYTQIVRWNNEESGFAIVDADKFANQVLPIFFKHSNLQSYIRQLNMYGFSKKRGKNQNYYSHPQFVKNRPQLISSIARKVEHKIPKNARTSTVSIQSQFISETNPLDNLLQMNYYLFLEQAANLKMILDELPEDSIKKQLENVIEVYLCKNKSIIDQNKSRDPDRTTLTFLDRSSG